MSKLFIKIFISFWLINIAVLLTMVASSTYFFDSENSSFRDAWNIRKQMLEVFAKAEYIAEQHDYAELERFIASAHVRDSVSFHLSPVGQSGTGRIALLADRLTPQQTVIIEETKENIFQAQLLLHQGQPFARLVMESPHPPSTLEYILREYVWVRLLLGILVSGLICFAMARSITRPVLALRQATRQLAEGNLNSRYQRNMPSNPETYQLASDEIGQLGEDFNYMAQRLQQTIEEQKQLVRDISHELRSPLGRIQAALALAQRKAGDDTAELKRVEKECSRLNELIGQLLVVPDTEKPLSDVIDLVGLLKDIAADDELRAQQANTSIVVETDLQELLVQTSDNLLWHAIDNIVRNALRHSPENSCIRIGLNIPEPGEWIRITVQDEGPGVAADLLDKIFHPFYRVETAREHGTGYGLGLSIAKRAIQRHDGSISAKNRFPGLEVEIRLPTKLRRNANSA